ncbi:uncharacterized protein LOC122509766 [Leptopilina heterotoma]|uniref:uncharacterized protein LOC122509766 n=1 Tax=Leptopilina heterotoma TaxID=63436 RepID=UPI001CA92F76|nr:uncharacterized protein LOC122509766 [Leptopilina heterotoma]
MVHTRDVVIPVLALLLIRPVLHQLYLSEVMTRLSNTESQVLKISTRLTAVEGSNKATSCQNYVRVEGDCSEYPEISRHSKENIHLFSCTGQSVACDGQNKRSTGRFGESERSVKGSSCEWRTEPENYTSSRNTGNCDNSTHKDYTNDKRTESDNVGAIAASECVGASYSFPHSLSDSCVSGPVSVRPVSIYYQNVRGVRTKLHLLRQSIPLKDYVIFILSETWLTPAINSSELGFTRYDIFRSDRCVTTSDKKLGGGVLLASKRSLSCTLICHKDKTLEYTIVKFKFNGSLHIFGAFYIPPNANIEKYNAMCNILEDISFLFPHAVISILGDFNMPYAIWDTNHNDDPSCFAKPGLLKLHCDVAENVPNTIDFLALKQINYIVNSQNNLLDLIFTNSIEFTLSKVTDPLLPLDNFHPVFVSSLYTSPGENTTRNNNNVNRQHCKTYKYDFDNAKTADSILNYLEGKTQVDVVHADFSKAFDRVDHASIVERFNETLKRKMWMQFSLRGNYKWCDILSNVIANYNDSKHRTIGIKPKDVTSEDVHTLKGRFLKLRKIPQRKPKFKIGDNVRVSKFKNVFEKGYTPNWTTKIFTIDKIASTTPVTYKLQD